ncbi:diguanylate cyclase [Sulfuricaulis limicola]|uniref:diguanylate cyclase n=1 Tax=Sulfuricaulis limicola TaxID=1620215 RepID=A0A1B4XDT5_9GAMM|nr:GGDEF domain-containing protein [Sulfuricaulis limicola]BAV32969.1 diguanylate cyclase [Sulfuricaulis limicola]
MSASPNTAGEQTADSRRRRKTDWQQDTKHRATLDAMRVPPWEEQRTQYLTRLLFWVLGLAYFNLGGAAQTSAWVSLAVFNAVFLFYGVEIAWFMRHAARRLDVRWRWHVTMWVDLLAASFAILADPAAISPGFLVYLMVILGNGMRYGLRLFAEAVAGSLLCALLIIGLRLFDYLDAISVSAAFFLLFFVIIVLYSYSLTANIEKGRRRTEDERDRDHLTGLLNRRALYERAERLFRDPATGSEPLVVLFADLDRFKAVNDNHGHHVGDRVLADIGRLFAGSVRDTDLVARYGGDEFLLILRDMDLAEAGVLAERLQKTLADWSRRENVDLSLSVGLGQYPDHGADLKAVIERVDQAMYRSKLVRGGGGILQVGQVVPAVAAP